MKTVLAFPADLHCGSTMGLIPAGPYQLEDGGTYHPNGVQKTLWRQWTEGWNRVAELRKGGRLIVVNAGDATEGIHHDFKQIVTPDLTTHKNIHIDCMDWALRTAGGADKLYYVAGTPIHVTVTESEIGRDLGAEPSLKDTPGKTDGRYCWPFLKLDVDGVLFWISHHGLSPGARAWTREGSILGALKSEYFGRLESREAIPPTWYIIAAHKHQHIAVQYSHRFGQMWGVILPAMQAKTEYVYRVASRSIASVGLFYVIIEDGQVRHGCERLELCQDRVIKL